ncbi:hypothetical protein EV122DRAFT_225242 [Schizophyllum commune]
MDHFTALPTALVAQDHLAASLDEEPLAAHELATARNAITNLGHGADVPVNEEHHGSCHTQNQYAWCIVC